MTLTDVGTRYNGMELSPERVAAFFSLTPSPSPKGKKKPHPQPLSEGRGE